MNNLQLTIDLIMRNQIYVSRHSINRDLGKSKI